MGTNVPALSVMNDAFKKFLEELAELRQAYATPRQTFKELGLLRFEGRGLFPVSPLGEVELPEAFHIQPDEKFFIGKGKDGQLLVMESIALAKLTRDYPEQIASDLETFGYVESPHLTWVGDDARFYLPLALRESAGIESLVEVRGHCASFSIWARQEDPGSIDHMLDELERDAKAQAKRLYSSGDEG